MIGTKFIVGIDISKDNFSVCAKYFDGKRSVIKGTRGFENNAAGFSAFKSWSLSKIKQQAAPHFVMEATGVYYEELTHFLYCESLDVSVVLPNKIKHFAKSLNIKTKTDKVDAAIIADYGLERTPELWKPMICELKNLRDLCRERLSLKQETTRLKCQLHALQHARGAFPEVLNMKQEQIDFFENTIKKIEKLIVQLVKSDKAFHARIKKLETIKGVRLLTIVTILCETNGFEQFNSIRGVVSYAGLDVCERQSGKFIGKTKISKKGNKRIRQCLYMPGLTATNHNVPIKKLYQRILEKNPKIKRKGIIAAMRKLLILIFVLWKKDEEYNPDFQWSAGK